jgi:exodeoxyribonuclease-3
LIARFRLVFLVAALLPASPDLYACEQTVRVMSFNAWGAGSNQGLGPEATIKAIRDAGADIVLLQEVRAEASECTTADCPAAGPSLASEIAAGLGYEFYEPPPDDLLNWANATLSRFPIVSTVSGGLGAMLDVGGLAFAVFNIHLTDFPYQPYQASGIPYGEAPFLDRPAALAQAAWQARGDAVNDLEAQLAFAGDAAVTVIGGDFNEPSHRDWTPEAVEAGRQPVAVAFPTVLALERLGFVDAYRAARPDEIADPGFTWTPTAALDDPGEHHDRIDYLLLRGEDAEIRGAWVVGESAENADIVVQPWTSDHRAVVVEIAVPDPESISPCSESPARSP